MSDDEVDLALARLLETAEGPDLIGITIESLHESLGNQAPHSVRQHGDQHQHSAMQEEEPAEQFQPTKYELQELHEELNKQFATTQLRETIDIFDHSTQKCSHVTQHCQTGSRIRFQDCCCFKVIFSKERKNNGKQSGGDQFSIATESSILDHSLTCSGRTRARSSSWSGTHLSEMVA
jgi:hypothetical protein